VPEFKAINPHDMTALRDAVATQTAYVGVTLYQGDVTLLPLDWNGAPTGALDTGHCIVPRDIPKAGSPMLRGGRKCRATMTSF